MEHGPCVHMSMAFAWERWVRAPRRTGRPQQQHLVDRTRFPHVCSPRSIVDVDVRASPKSAEATSRHSRRLEPHAVIHRSLAELPAKRWKGNYTSRRRGSRLVGAASAVRHCAADDTPPAIFLLSSISGCRPNHRDKPLPAQERVRIGAKRAAYSQSSASEIALRAPMPRLFHVNLFAGGGYQSSGWRQR